MSHTQTHWIVPRETKEWIGPVAHTPSVHPLELALLPRGTRPTEEDWSDPVETDDGAGIMLEGFDPGEYHLWGRVTSPLEIPVVESFAIVEVR